ncbi:hypothetical protein M569_13906 [Genlisea aurea]|uniref:Uncharacterized protein n=1 Tax=Genlisea aurea TaxID=192259 RepID=S8C2K7_9LAMI|nr:hypothetical protein M569_13906 [Genlisea aurea]
MDPEILAKMAKWMEMYQRVAGIFTPEQLQDFVRTCPPPTLTTPGAESSKTTTPSPSPAKLPEKIPETAEATPDLTAPAPPVAIATDNAETLGAEAPEKRDPPALASASRTTSVGKTSPQGTQATTPEPPSEKVTGSESFSANAAADISEKEGEKEHSSEAKTPAETGQQRSVGTPGSQTRMEAEKKSQGEKAKYVVIPEAGEDTSEEEAPDTDNEPDSSDAEKTRGTLTGKEREKKDV